VVKQPGSFWRSWAFWAKLGAGVAVFLLIVAVVGVYWLRLNARGQRDAVAAIKAKGGQVSYPWDDPQASDTPIVFSRPGLPNWLISWTGSGDDSGELGPAAPAWLVAPLGVDCFGDVTSVVMPRGTSIELMERLSHLEHIKRLRIQYSVVSEPGMKAVGQLVHLEHLTFFRSRFLKGGFAHLANLQNLRTLNLEGTTVDDDATLTSLKGLTALTELNLGDTKITDLGMPSLRGLNNLEDLNLNRALISDTGLSQLAGLTALARLSIIGTRLNGTGLAHLKGLTRLEELSLESTGVGDAGLVHLAGLVNLKILRLNGTKVGDAGVAHLKGLTKLEELSLDHTAITDAGLADLTTLPHLAILSVQNTRVTDDAVRAQNRRRAQLQVQQLAATGSGVVPPETAITELEIVH
jgi:Leucine Rich repeat